MYGVNVVGAMQASFEDWGRCGDSRPGGGALRIRDPRGSMHRTFDAREGSWRSVRVSVLLGRQNECETLDRLLRAVRAGQSRALVLCGDAGDGQDRRCSTTCPSRPASCRLARVTGVQSEMELPFSGLHQLCAPMLDRLARLPDPQREAIGTAFRACETGPVPDRLPRCPGRARSCSPMVARGAAARLRRSTTRSGSIARRPRRWPSWPAACSAESVAMVFATRTPARRQRARRTARSSKWQAWPTHDARTLLRSAVHVPLDERVRDRIVAETRGNPSAILELPRGLTHAELAGGFGSARRLSVWPRGIEESFQRRAANLAAGDTASAAGRGRRAARRSGSCLARCGEHAGIDRAWNESAAAAGPVRVRPARSLPPPARPLGDLPRRVRRRAPERFTARSPPPPTRTPNPTVGRGTAPTARPGPTRPWPPSSSTRAGQAQARGGAAATAAFLQRAVRLTPDAGNRTPSEPWPPRAPRPPPGRSRTALALVAIRPRAGPLDELGRAHAELLGARIAFAMRRANDAPRMLLGAAGRLESLDPELARDGVSRSAAPQRSSAGRLSDGVGSLDVAHAVRAAGCPADATGPARATSCSTGSCRWALDGCSSGAPVLTRAVHAFVDQPADHGVLQRLWLATVIASSVWDDTSADVLSDPIPGLRSAHGRADRRCPPRSTDASACSCSPASTPPRRRWRRSPQRWYRRSVDSSRPYGELGLAAWRGRES